MGKKPKATVSVVLPTYNEKGNIKQLAEELIAAIRGSGYDEELVIVDDSSPDGTFESVRELMRKHKSVKGILRKNERGLATAIRKGIESSRGSTIVVMDCDFSHPPEVIPKMLAEIEGGADAVFASRYAKGGSMAGDRMQYYLSSLFNCSIKKFLGIPIHDCTNGFLAIRKKALEGLDKGRIFSGYGDYCFKLIYLLRQKGIRFKEIPFKYMPRRYGSSKTSLAKEGIAYWKAAIKLRAGK